MATKTLEEVRRRLAAEEPELRCRRHRRLAQLGRQIGLVALGALTRESRTLVKPYIQHGKKNDATDAAITARSVARALSSSSPVSHSASKVWPGIDGSAMDNSPVHA